MGVRAMNEPRKCYNCGLNIFPLGDEWIAGGNPTPDADGHAECPADGGPRMTHRPTALAVVAIERPECTVCGGNVFGCIRAGSCGLDTVRQAGMGW